MANDTDAVTEIRSFSAEYTVDGEVLAIQLMDSVGVVGSDGTERQAWPLRASITMNGSLTFDSIYYLDQSLAMVAQELPCGYAPWSCHERILDYAYEGFQFPFGVGLGAAALDGEIPLGPPGNQHSVDVASGPVFRVLELENDSTNPAFRRSGSWTYEHDRLYPVVIPLGDMEFELSNASTGARLGHLDRHFDATRPPVDRNRPWLPPALSEPLWLDVSVKAAYEYLRREAPVANELAAKGCVYTATVLPQGRSAAGLLSLDEGNRIDYSITLTDGQTRGQWIVSYVDVEPPEWRIEDRGTRAGGTCSAQASADAQGGRWSAIEAMRPVLFAELGEPTAYSIRIWPEEDPALTDTSTPILSVLYAGSDLGGGFSTPYRISTNGVTGALYRVHLPA